MTNLLASAVADRLLVMTGWILAMTLWETTALGVLLAAWRVGHPRASAQQRHRAGIAAFGAAVPQAGVTTLALPMVAPSPSMSMAGTPVAAPPASPGLRLPQRRDTERAVSTEARPSGFPADTAAASAALEWAAGVLILGIRLLGGGILAASIRKQARPVPNESGAGGAERLGSHLRRCPPVALLQSHHVEGPVVLGWRRPPLILPTDVTDRLTPGMIDAVLAHEFAHIERRDYVANLVQSVVELLLFFSPAVAWMSRSIREAREYCCDDIAVERCGDPKHYIHALTTLASLATVNTVRPALSAAGPRLIVRVRRLLQEEPMPRFPSMRLLALGATLVMLIVTGQRVTTASAAYASRFLAADERAGARTLQARIPFGYATEQDGSGVELGPVVWGEDDSIQHATLRNMTNERITAVGFVAVVEGIGVPLRKPVRVFPAGPIAVLIAPGQSVEVSPKIVSVAQLRALGSALPDRLQVFIGLESVRFSNGAQWTITPNPAATSGRDALGIQRAEISRELLAAAASVSGVSVCRDEKGRSYSLGAIVPVRNEPGRFARCTNGRWEESAPGR